MEAEEENPSSTPIESSHPIPIPIPDIEPEPEPEPEPETVPPPVVPSIAPIPAVPPPAIRPLAPPVIKPPVPQNGGDLGTSDSGSDSDTPASNLEYEISEESRVVRERQEKAMQELLMKRRASALAVPTNDVAVRARLRRLGEPITLFGEREMERRDRLRMIMVRLDTEGQLEKLMRANEEEEAAAASSVAAAEEAEEEMVQYPFFTEGSKALRDARIDIAKYSLVRGALRLQRAQRRRDDPDEDVDSEMDWALMQAGTLALDCSEIGDDRPLSGCSFSPDGSLLATWYARRFSESISYIKSLCLL